MGALQLLRHARAAGAVAGGGRRESRTPASAWTQADALKLYGLFTGFVYFTPLIGGWLADNYLGQRKSVIIGGLVMAAGQFTLAAAIPGNLQLFYVGLVLLVLGNGFFKPNISTMVGDLYPEGDARRDGAFTIFYMGINAGAFLAPLVCSHARRGRRATAGATATSRPASAWCCR